MQYNWKELEEALKEHEENNPEKTGFHDLLLLDISDSLWVHQKIYETLRIMVYDILENEGKNSYKLAKYAKKYILPKEEMDKNKRP